MSTFLTLFIVFVCYFIYKFLRKNRLSPEQKELLKVANSNKITDKETITQFVNQEITLEKAKQIQDEIIKENQKKAKAKADREAKAKADREAKAKAERELIEKLSSSNNRTYFCYSIVNTESLLYLINPENNRIIESSRTDLSTLYKEGWRLIDLDKTGRNAQLDGFNAVLRLERN